MSKISNCFFFRPCPGAPRKSLSVRSSPDDSGSVHGSGDEHVGISGGGETSGRCTGSGYYFFRVIFIVGRWQNAVFAISHLFIRFLAQPGGMGRGIGGQYPSAQLFTMQ